jgi:hypothetical protein
MDTSTDPSPGSYTITGGEQGKRRLYLLAAIMRPTTLRLLAEAGLRGGDRCQGDALTQTSRVAMHDAAGPRTSPPLYASCAAC